jgi:hypothetical protein
MSLLDVGYFYGQHTYVVGADWDPASIGTKNNRKIGKGKALLGAMIEGRRRRGGSNLGSGKGVDRDKNYQRRNKRYSLDRVSKFTKLSLGALSSHTS